MLCEVRASKATLLLRRLYCQIRVLEQPFNPTVSLSFLLRYLPTIASQSARDLPIPNWSAFVHLSNPGISIFHQIKKRLFECGSGWKPAAGEVVKPPLPALKKALYEKLMIRLFYNRLPPRRPHSARQKYKLFHTPQIIFQKK